MGDGQRMALPNAACSGVRPCLCTTEFFASARAISASLACFRPLTPCWRTNSRHTAVSRLPCLSARDTCQAACAPDTCDSIAQLSSRSRKVVRKPPPWSWTIALGAPYGSSHNCAKRLATCLGVRLRRRPACWKAVPASTMHNATWLRSEASLKYFKSIATVSLNASGRSLVDATRGREGAAA